ncbi:MAG: SdrD B-like domain-containing protein, partial [Planctomycetota bacterium]
MIWKRKRHRQQRRPNSPDPKRRVAVPQVLERRELLAADPIHVGVVYLETDYLESDNDVGSDSRGDRFLLTFNGGAADTVLSELRINTDKFGDGISIGDPIFDTQSGGLGKSSAHPFQIVSIEADGGRQPTVSASVADGGQELILQFNGFQAGDRLEFTLDVDEVLVPYVQGDEDQFNESLDVITSGQEFQNSILQAMFEAPHFETASADAIFRNDYELPEQGDLNLPADDGDGPDSRPNRSAAAFDKVTQEAKPVSISGHVWLDDNLDAIWQDFESGIEGVQLSLAMQTDSGVYQDTGFRTATDSNGYYEFSRSLPLTPGNYQVIQTQPVGLFSVGAFPGSVGGQSTGIAEGDNVLTEIALPLGDTDAVEMNFAEARPASLSGFVYRDDNNDGIRQTTESGLAGVTVRLVPVGSSTAADSVDAVTDASGAYSFAGLRPGQYEVIEVNQPAGLLDGLDSAGTISGVTVGVAENPGDAIRGISLRGGDVGIEYNFGEIAYAEISGFVYLAAPGADCTGELQPGSDEPLEGVLVELQRPDGNVISRVSTTANGSYSFTDVEPGEYRIVQYTPDGLIDGRAFPGMIDGVRLGDSESGMMISRITLSPADVGVEYNFCEIAPANLSGWVYYDASQNGVRDNGEAGIPNTTVMLVDENGDVVQTTISDAEGRYEFRGLPPGNYEIRQEQPADYLDGGDSLGTIAGVPTGSVANDRFFGINLPQGLSGVEYNFGEILPASLSGRVHLDLDGDCIRDPDEQDLAGVTIRLFDDSGVQVAQTVTDAQGRYQFDNLIPGRYSVVQDQPSGVFDGGVSPGSEGGIAGTNEIRDIVLGSGVSAVDYDFCEVPPASLSGLVHEDRDGDCIRDPDEIVLEGVVIQLYNENGELVAQTETNAEGIYRFTNLPSGRYSIQQIQPDGWFDGGAKSGSEGGTVGENEISAIALAAGIDGTDYDFCEQPPASVSGIVHVDHDGDCIVDAEEPRLSGVLIELRDASGTTVDQTLTDSEGRYEFSGLRGGTYTIFENQPEGYLQGGQRLGSAGGLVLGVDLLSVTLTPGQAATDYLFCEHQPGSIAGSVWADRNQNQEQDPGEAAIAGVTVELVDDQGQVIRQTQTGADGSYEFGGLERDVYGVRQQQPEGFFHGGQLIGSRGGTITGDDWMTGIEIGSGIDAVEYDFPEIPPATISGRVFIDGPTLETETEIAAEDLRDYKDGRYTTDDVPLESIRVELRDELGNPLTPESFLSGTAEEASVVMTDVEGVFSFRGLRPGT